MRSQRKSATSKKTTTRSVAAARGRVLRNRKVAVKPSPRHQSVRPPAQRSATRRTTTPTRARVAIPAILLEGDHPTLPMASGPGEKFAVSPTTPAPRLELESAELPEAYGTNRLHLTARDPHWLYANWDFARQQQLRYNKQSVDGHLILRIYAGAVSGKPISEIHVHPESRHWFANVERAGAKYAAEIGFYQRNRKWMSLAASEPTATPPETTASDAAAEFATIPVTVPFKKLVEIVSQVAQEHRPLAQAVEEIRQTGHPELPRLETRPTAPWTRQQEQALEEIIKLDQVQRVWIGSLEITELVRDQLEREISSISVAPLGQLAAPGAGVSAVSSPSGGELARGKGFWFNVNAELIVYGATEPDASVTIGGRKIKLRPDGSFTYRFSLPDGQYDLPVVAVSADATDGRAAELKFARRTEFLGDVGAHSQDPALKPPTLANV
jgi:uncharacterized protein